MPPDASWWLPLTKKSVRPEAPESSARARRELPLPTSSVAPPRAGPVPALVMMSMTPARAPGP